MTIDELLEDMEGTVRSLSWSFYTKLPATSNYTAEDLEQEARIGIVEEYNRGRFNPEECKVTTYYLKNVIYTLNTILRAEYREKRSFNADFNTDVDNIIDAATSPESAYLFNKFIEAVKEVSTEFADMLVNGVPKELRLYERSYRRRRIRSRRCYRCTALNSKVVYSKRMIEMFFDINLTKIRDLYYNIYERS